MQCAVTVLLAIFIAQTHSAPQLITFNEGKLGVNFGGYHAGVGLGGLLGGGAGGGLFAEAGTPHGQSARAGLGGAVDAEGSAGGSLYAGATAGGNVKAEAGLGGIVGSETAAGDGYASANAGGHHAVSSLAGESFIGGSTGVTFSGTKSVHVPSTVVKETKVSVIPVETVKHKKVHTDFNVDSLNEVNALPLTPVTAGEVETNLKVETHAEPTVVVKEVYVEPQPKIVEKHIIRTYTKPRHHVSKTAYIGGYIGGGADIDSHTATIHKTIHPAIERRVDVGSASVGATVDTDVNANIGGSSTYTKKISVSRNPNLFQDIFNIPISTLQAVSRLLTNTAGSTSVSVEKSASLHADSDSISPKHASSSFSEAQISVQTPKASQIIDDIFAIPINTLSAVNKFLENNVPVRKRLQVAQSESEEPTRIRLGPHARRRAHKQVIVVQNGEDQKQ